MPVAIDPVDEVVDTDVLVVGSGIAALTAAVAAMKDGASAMAEGYFFSTNTGDADGLYQLFCDRAAKGHSDEFPVDSMLHVLADNNDAALGMIRSTGVDILPLKEFTDITATESGEADTKARSAWRLIESLSAFVEENGGVIYTATPATELLMDASGAVVGAVSETARGRKTFNARATVLACGDYARNADMMRELIPQSQACYTVTAVGNTGDGMTLGAPAGAQFYPDQYVQGGPLIFDPTDVYRGSYSSPAFASICMIASLDGDRRVGEDKGTRPIHYSYTNHEKADGAWCVMDSTTAADCEGVAELVEQTTPDSFVQAYEADNLFHLALATQGPGGRPVDPGELGVPVGVRLADLLHLPVALQAEPQGPQHLADLDVADVPALGLLELGRYPAQALGGPRQRRVGRPVALPVDQAQDLLGQAREALLEGPAAAAGPAHAARGRVVDAPRPQLAHAGAHGVARAAGRPGDDGDPAPAQALGFGAVVLAQLGLVQQGRDPADPLFQCFLVDVHARMDARRGHAVRACFKIT